VKREYKKGRRSNVPHYLLEGEHHGKEENFAWDRQQKGRWYLVCRYRGHWGGFIEGNVLVPIPLGEERRKNFLKLKAVGKGGFSCS